jgi:hypothetical protein
VELVEKNGFELENLLPFNRTGVTAWWLNGRVLKRRTFGLWQIKMLNLLTPIFRRVDRWLPLPPLSLIAFARKPLAKGATPSADSAPAPVSQAARRDPSFD